jgi:lipooligosaccharide transport system permease protein
VSALPEERFRGLGPRPSRHDLIPSPRLALAVWRRNALVFSKVWRGALLPTFLDPLLYLFALGFALGTYLSSVAGIPYREFIGTGLIASAALWAASFESTYNVYLRMNETRLYDAVLVTPVEVQDIVAGDLLWGATRATIYSTVFLAAVAAFGLLASPLALLIPPFVLIGGLCFASLGYTFTALIPKIDLYSFFFTLVVTPMFLFSGIFFPFDRLPGWVEVIAFLTPLYHLVEITRALSFGEVDGWLAVHAAWLLAVSALLFVVPVRALRARLLA